MAVLFFDTSALVRRYDSGEPGSDRVRALCRASAGHSMLVARIAHVEVASALNRKLREGRLDRPGRDRRWRLFRLHARDQYRAVALDDEIVRMAQRLIFDHPLRAFDALHLASALWSRRLLADLAPDFRFCTADRAQAGAAEREGTTVELIS